MARKTDMVARGGDYSPAKGSARVKGSGTAKQVRKPNRSASLPGWMDSRPENSDRNQSAK